MLSASRASENWLRSILDRRPRERWAFRDERFGAEGEVAIEGGRIRGRGNLCAVSAIDPARLPASLKRLSSQRSIPWPLDIEVGASPEEIAVGARVSAIVGLTARGLIRLGFAQRWGWWRDGTEVVAEPLTEVHEIEAIVSSVDREAWTHEPPLERALVEVLAELGERFDYRVVERSWVRLSTVLERAWAPIGLGGLVPVWSMDLGSGEEEIALENLELEIPGLVSGLARVVVEREVA